MLGRLSVLSGLTAAALAHGLPRSPDAVEWAGLWGAVLVAAFVLRRRRPTWIMPAVAFLSGWAWVSVNIDHRSAEFLRDSDEDKVSRVVLRIETLPQVSSESRRFDAYVLESLPDGVPRRIRVSWHAPGYSGPYGRRPNAQKAFNDEPEFPSLVPGQVWRMSLNLRRPHGLSNPHGFDYEQHVFAAGVRAVGSVRGTPRYLYDQPWSSLSVIAERTRHRVREAMAPYLENKRYGPVLLALAIGDQAGVPAADWLTFNRTSITHLISISGSHITMIAALGGMLTLWLWRRLSLGGVFLAERVPAQVAACVAALLVAWLYCLLAGWGVPARRTFLMLCVLAFAHVSRLPLGPWRVLLLAATAVVILDPWALLASGFWLSFGAVAVLLTSGRWIGEAIDGAESWRHWRWLVTAAKLQLTVTAGLMPVLALMFNEVSVVSPFANAYAIPVISLVVTPLALVLAAVAMVPGSGPAAGVLAWLAHLPLSWMMAPTHWLAGLKLASIDAAAAPGWAVGLALIGLAWALMPQGLPWRGMGWLLMLPALFWKPERPPRGSWDMVALDVGQGSAVLFMTQNHTLLFDTGIRHGPETDAAARNIVPFLRARGIGRIDVLVVSHADIDHAGGLRSVLESRLVTQSYSSFDMVAYLKREARLLGVSRDLPVLPAVISRCHYGARWVVDGVKFEFLWPLPTAPLVGTNSDTKLRNAQSCVLRIQGRHHFALLTGDISAAQETELVARDIGPIDVLVAAHHGSRSSSDPELVRHTGPSHVIAQAGRWNRYGHPHAVVERRWQRSGATFWRTDQDGAIMASSRDSGLQVKANRSGRNP